jgi:hypothetical protein
MCSHSGVNAPHFATLRSYRPIHFGSDCAHFWSKLLKGLRARRARAVVAAPQNPKLLVHKTILTF